MGLCMHMALICTPMAGLVMLSCALPAGAQPSLAPYVAPPMHLAMRPLRFGSEFVPPAKAAVVFQGQTVVVHLSLSNSYSEPIEVRTGTLGWDQAATFSAVNTTAATSAVALERIPADQSLVPVRGAQVRAVGPGAVLFQGRDAQEITRAFRVQSDDGTLVLRAVLPLVAVRVSGVKLPQSLEATITLDLVTPANRAEQLETLYREALAARNEGRTGDARGYLDELLRASQNSSAALLLRGDVAASQGDRQQARRDYEEATRVLEAHRDADSALLRRTSSAYAARLRVVQAKLRALPKESK